MQKQHELRLDSLLFDFDSDDFESDTRKLFVH